MAVIFILLFFVYFKMISSQYYAQPTYQPYSPLQPVPQPYATPTFAPSLGFPPAYTPSPIYPAPSYAPNPPISMFAPNSLTPSLPPHSFYSTLQQTPNFSTLGSPLCHPSTASAYYLTPAPEVPKVFKERVKKNTKDKLPPPTYYCPFCTGFANVPRNAKVPPPPSCSPVLPGILDQLPTIALPDSSKLKDLCKLTPSPTLLSDLMEHKLSGKMRFDEDLLDGFLTGLGLTKCEN